MNTPTSAVLIPAATYRPMEIITIHDLDEGLDFLVGGVADVILPVLLQQLWWVNEDRNSLGLARNDRATHLARRHRLRGVTDYSTGGHIAGDMVVTGGSDRTGEPLSLPEEQALRLIRNLDSYYPAPV